MNVLGRYVPVVVIAAILWALWPSGLPGDFASRAALAGVSAETISLYVAASPSTALPMAALLWIVFFSDFVFLLTVL